MIGSTGTRPVEPAAIPWADRDDPAAPPSRRMAAARSTRELDTLRSLARRIPAGDAGAHNNLGVVYYGNSLYAEAVEQLERALELDSGMQVAERNLQIVYFATGYYDELVSSLHMRLELDPDDAEARRRLALTYLYGGDPAAAIDEWRNLLRAFPRDARLYQRIARAEHKRGDLDAALVALRNAGAIAPRDARIQLRLGEVLYQRGMHVDALVPLERAVALDDAMAEAHHLLSCVHGELGDTEQAGRSAERAAELNPGRVGTTAHSGLSLDGHSVARYEELVGDRSTRHRVAEGGALAHFSLGVAFRQKGLFEEALREFRLADEHGEDPFLVLQARAEVVLLRGGAQQAAELYDQLIEQEPASPKLHNELGVARHQLGRLADAERAYRRALELDPVYTPAWNNLAVVRRHRGDDVDAQATFGTGLERASRPLAVVWWNLGLMLERAGRDTEAERAYRRALEVEPDWAAAWSALGALLLGTGRVEKARLSLARAVEADPQLAEARYHFALALSATGDYAAALREMRIALEPKPHGSASRFRLLIDLESETVGVPAPELDRPDQCYGGRARGA